MKRSTERVCLVHHQQVWKDVVCRNHSLLFCQEYQEKINNGKINLDYFLFNFFRKFLDCVLMKLCMQNNNNFSDSYISKYLISNKNRCSLQSCQPCHFSSNHPESLISIARVRVRFSIK